MNVHGREYLYFSRYPQKTREAIRTWFISTVANLYITKRRKGEKEIDLHRTQ